MCLYVEKHKIRMATFKNNVIITITDPLLVQSLEKGRILQNKVLFHLIICVFVKIKLYAYRPIFFLSCKPLIIHPMGGLTVSHSSIFVCLGSVAVNVLYSAVG